MGKLPLVQSVPASIPKSTKLGALRLDSAKSYPTKLWEDKSDIQVAYADLLNKEDIWLVIQQIPSGYGKKNHPQIGMYIQGDYHVERLTYFETDPFNWATWFEMYFPLDKLGNLIRSLQKAQEVET